MIRDDDVKVFLFLAVAISCLGVNEVIEPKHLAYAHFFTSDQSAEFLSLAHQINAEISLINNTFPSEIDSSYHHAKNARAYEQDISSIYCNKSSRFPNNI